jgi:DNA-directed RNA polymerase specialized sigma24 family protein
MGVRTELPEADILRIYHETLRPLYAWVARRAAGDAGLTEALVQETWMRALAAWPARGVPDDPLAWLIRVARDTLASHFRRKRPDAIDPALLDVEDERFSADSSDAAAVIGWGMARLRRAHVDVLEAFYFDGCATGAGRSHNGPSVNFRC